RFEAVEDVGAQLSVRELDVLFEKREGRHLVLKGPGLYPEARRGSFVVTAALAAIQWVVGITRIHWMKMQTRYQAQTRNARGRAWSTQATEGAVALTNELYTRNPAPQTRASQPDGRRFAEGKRRLPSRGLGEGKTGTQSVCHRRREFS